MKTNKFLPTNWNNLKCIIGYVTLLYQLAVSQRLNFSPVKTCTQLTLKEIPVNVFDNCTGPGLVIHCLPDSQDNLGLSCYPPRWISPGQCPYYNTYQGNMDEKACNSKYGKCSTGQFRSPLSVMYGGCYIKEEQIITTTEALTTEAMKTTTCEPVKSNCSTFASAAGEDKSTSCTGAIAAIITLSVIIIALVFVLVLKFTPVTKNMPCLQNSGSDNSGHPEDVMLNQSG